MNHLLTLSSLGAFKVSFASASVARLNSEKLSALLIYLAMKAGHKIRREYLSELLWPGMSTESARSNLRHAFFYLRQSLGDDANAQPFLLSGREWLSFNQDSNFRFDALEFGAPLPVCPGGKISPDCRSCLEQMEGMSGLYRGEFMADLSLPDCAEFGDWLDVERETMRRHALVLLERLSACHEKINGHGAALPFAQRYLELEPWNEEGHRRVMRIYALNDQTGAALAQYNSCSGLLKKELGVLPGPETQQLAESIRNGSLRKKSVELRGVRRRASDVHTRDIRSGEVEGVLTVRTLSPQLSERRQATVVYCELTHAENEDIDDALEKLRAPQARCAAIIRKYSGHLVDTYGGGLLAYFGYPSAREDAAIQAVKAALAIVREAGNGIEIRAGVHTGLIITSADSSVPDVPGKTSKLAILMRQVAGPGEVAISRDTYRMVSGYFDCSVISSQPISGMDALGVTRESGARTRLEAAAQLTPLAGRKGELAELMVLWEKAAHGSRQVALIKGDAGIGKSRLLHTLKQCLCNQPHTIRELCCFPEFSQSPFYPLITVFKANWDFSPGDTPELEFGKLERYIGTHYPAMAQEAIPLLAELLSLPLPGHYPASEFSPAKKKELTIDILIDMLQAQGEKKTVLFIVEDLQWIDHSTLEMLARLIDKRGAKNIFVVLTARTEFVQPWNEAINPVMALAPLVGEEVVEMIASLKINIPAALLRQIVKRADGVPLYVEEIARMVKTNDQSGIPATLHDLLAARLDSMGESKKTAQLAAGIGREFDIKLLGKISPLAPAALDNTLHELVRSGLILENKNSIFRFKHALIQEAAYQSQTKTDRQAVHRRIAQTLQRDFTDVAANQPELLAQHWAAADEMQQAVAYWMQAGQRATRRSANLEAIAHFNSGLQLLANLPPEQARDHMEFELCVNLGSVLIAAKGYGSAETWQTYDRALELSAQSGDSAGMFMALCGMWLSSGSRVNHLHSLEYAEKLLRLAEQSGDPLELQQAHYAMGASLCWSGALKEVLAHLERSISLYQQSHHEAMAGQYGRNTCVLNRSLQSWVLWLQGFPGRAAEADRQAIAVAQQANHPFSLACALAQSSILHRWMKQVETTERLALEVMALSREHGFPMGIKTGESAYGWTRVMRGQAEGIVPIRQSVEAVKSIMSGSTVSFFTALIEAHVHLGQFDDALLVLNDAFDAVNAKEDRFFESEFYRLKGLCLLGMTSANADDAETCFNRALAISRKQGAKSLELRAAICMSRLWQRQGKAEKARLLLDGIYSWFTEGLETADLQEATALMQELA